MARRQGPAARVAGWVQVARETAVLVRAGVLAPGRPDRVVGQLVRLRQFGPTLAGAFAAAAVRAPARTALSDETTSRTFADVDRRVRGIARGLTARGVRADTPVALLGRNSVPFVEALVATSRLGADALLLSSFLSPMQVRDVLARERPRLVVADPELLPLLAQASTELPVVTTTPAPGQDLGDLDELAATPGPEPRRPGRRGRLVVLTSGTTGTPKGARRPAPTSLSPAASMLSRLRLAKGDVIMISSPLFHTWGLGVLQIAPALAATVVLRRRADPDLILAAVDHDRCTALVALPVILERLLQLDSEVRARHDTSRLRVVASSGSALSAEVATRFQDTFGDVLYNLYGSTEVSWATIADPADLRAAAGTAGRPPLGTRLEILDEQGEQLPRGEVGHIFVGNDLLFEGYTNGSDKQRLDGLMATGDRGFIDPGGRLMVVGREDDLIITGGENIYPLEVEEVIAAQPGVREVAVVGQPDAEFGQRLVAYVVLHAPGALEGSDIQDHVREHLARFAVPKEVVFLDALPRTPTGKVVRRMLPPTQPTPPV